LIERKPYLNNTAVKWEFNKSATTFISYSAVTPTDDAMKQNLDNELDRTT
jgi:hypothetical protein